MVRGIVIFLLALAIIFVASVAFDPTFSSMSVDGGAFAYCGQQIARGALLYRDCWDNKPPAIYYLNAAVIAVGGASQWNIWLFQAVWLSVTALAFYEILRRIWTGTVALLCTILLLLTVLYPLYFSGGNLTEIYALLPITLTMGVFWKYLQTHKNRYLAAIGFFAALAFLFKPTYAALGIGASLVLAYMHLRQRNYRSLLRVFGWIGVSFALPLLLVGAYWFARNDVYDLLYAVFIHNQQYVEQGFSIRAIIITLRIFIIEQPFASLFALAIISLVVYVVENWKVLFKFDPDQAAMDNPSNLHAWFIAGLIITFALDTLFTALPGTNFRHYFEIPILTLTALSSYLIYRLSQQRLIVNKDHPSSLIMFSAVLVIILPWVVEVIGKEFPNRANWSTLFAHPNVTQFQPNEIEKFILENTNSNQTILIWDYDPSIYFHVNRRSPTRFIYLRHIFTPIPGATNGFDEFMQAVQNDPPELIISSKTSQQGLPYLGFSENEICSDCSPAMRQLVVVFKRYVSQHYQPYTDIDPWAVYKRVK